jgi:murein DD-endopeptidase MepM/ murein hydrolase activator NlpD
MRPIILFIVVISSLSITLAQSEASSLIFVWKDAIYSLPLDGSQMSQIGVAGEGFGTLTTSSDAYTLDASPLSDLPSDGFGFHHGIWSPDRQQFAYLELSPPYYHVRVITADGADNILIDSEITDSFGYLDPISWTDTGEILLVERVALNHLHKINIFKLNLNTGALDFHTAILPGHLVGRTALLPDGYTVFLGFDLSHTIGILLDTINGRISNFPTTLNTVFPPIRGFQYYPIQVYGIMTSDELLTLMQNLQTLPATPHIELSPNPFLHWPLADEYRYITCYPDSEWTHANFDTTCPGLAGRNYEGHQGTDISDEPDGLLIGTPVYPMAVGSVVASYRGCIGQNPSCNNSYGNTVTLEHIRIIEGETQVWYTGYGHLQMVIADNASLVTDLTQPIALSGATGVGGAHLHLEVRNDDGWVNPWDDLTGDSLWIGGNQRPLSLIEKIDIGNFPKILDICTAYAGNNIRSGAGTTFDAVGKTQEDTTYYVTNIEYVGSGEAIGDWYEVLFSGGSGWLWSGLMNCP